MFTQFSSTANYFIQPNRFFVTKQMVILQVDFMFYYCLKILFIIWAMPLYCVAAGMLCIVLLARCVFAMLIGRKEDTNARCELLEPFIK